MDTADGDCLSPFRCVRRHCCRMSRHRRWPCIRSTTFGDWCLPAGAFGDVVVHHYFHVNIDYGTILDSWPRSVGARCLVLWRGILICDCWSFMGQSHGEEIPKGFSRFSRARRCRGPVGTRVNCFTSISARERSYRSNFSLTLLRNWSLTPYAKNLHPSRQRSTHKLKLSSALSVS